MTDEEDQKLKDAVKRMRARLHMWVARRVDDMLRGLEEALKDEARRIRDVMTGNGDE